MVDETEAELGRDDIDARDWESRLGWAFGLVADDPTDRAVALARYTEARNYVRAMRERYNEAWFLTRPLGEDQRREPMFLQREKAYFESKRYVFPGGLGDRPYDGLRDWPGLRYALLYLEWEAKFPQEWTRHSKAWGLKRALIRDLSVGEHSVAVQVRLIDLIEMAVSRAYRYKDREYVRLARAVAGDDLRSRLAVAADSVNPWARIHAGYVLRTLENPELPNSRRNWETWCAGGNLDR